MFAEKVLAPTMGQAGDIIAAANRSGVTLLVSLPRLYHGYTRTLSELVSSERLGLLTYGRVRLCHDGATTGWLPERFLDPEEAVGGALIDLGCHPAYLIQLFLGERPTRNAYRTLVPPPLRQRHERFPRA
jgi:1,5-anhydro-D-fructose reductase (1,5-anhydro-D-mannitol-forming)